jgi:lysophospholipase L1-like esterase
MRSRGRLAAALTIAASLALVAPASAGADAIAPAAQVRYVAVGDSYSSGVGSGGYSDGACDQSPQAYPARWAAAAGVHSFAFAACAGADVASVTADQLRALDPSTSLVTITVGGNDVDFAGVMTDCVVRGTSTCLREVGAAEAGLRGTLEPRLIELYRSIGYRAPHASLVVLGYPDFYDTAQSCLGLSADSRGKIDQGIDQLDAVIADAAHFVSARFVDVRTAFAGHEICDHSSWLRSIDLTEIAASYHPTAAGQQAYAGALAAAITAARDHLPTRLVPAV